MNWIRRREIPSILRTQLQQAHDEIQQVKKDYEKVLRDRELDDEAVRRMLTTYSDELSKVKVSLEEQKSICQSLLQDKAKLQSELIDHLKLLRLRDERLGRFRRDLADSEFEVDQMRVALRCTTVYSLQLEADKQAAEVVIKHVCTELDRVVAMALLTLDTDASVPFASLAPADLGSVAPSPSKLSRCSSTRGHSNSDLNNAVAGCSRKAAATASSSPAPQMVVDGCEALAESGSDKGRYKEEKTSPSSESCTPRIVGADGLNGDPDLIREGEPSCGSEGMAHHSGLCHVGLTGKSSKGFGPPSDITSLLRTEKNDVRDIQGRRLGRPGQSSTANHCSQATVSSAATPLVSAGLAGLYDFVAHLPKHLWTIRQQVHELIKDPEAAAAAAAALMASTRSGTADKRPDDTTADARTGGAPAAPLGARGRAKVSADGSGSRDAEVCPLSAPPLVSTAGDALLQMYGMATAKPRRSGNEPMAEYDAAMGAGVQDWGHRRHASLAAADGELIARLMIKSRERRGGGGPQVPGGITANGATGVGGMSSSASVPLTPHQRPPVLACLSEALKGLAPGHSAGSSTGGGSAVVSGIRHAVVVQGRRMAGAASPPSPLSLSLLSSPTRCSSAHMPLSPVASPTSAMLLPCSFGKAGSSGGTGLTVTSSRGGDMDTGVDGPPGPAAAVEGFPTLPPTALSSAEKEVTEKEQPEQKQQQQQQQRHHHRHHAEHEGTRQHAQELDSEVVSLRLTNEALQRQVAELQRQNDLLQLRQLGSSGGGDGGSHGLYHGGWCSQYPQPLHLPHPQEHFLSSQTSHAFGQRPWSEQEKTAATATATAAATASPYNSPLSAPFYYGSLPPGQQPTMGVATGADEPPPLFPKSEQGSFGTFGGASRRAGAMTSAGALRVSGTAPWTPRSDKCKPLQAALHAVSGPTTAVATGTRTTTTRATLPHTAETVTMADPQIHNSKEQLALSHAGIVSNGEVQAMKASTADLMLLPPLPLAVPPAPASSAVGSLAAKASPPPGIDPELWELDLLVSCSKGAGGL